MHSFNLAIMILDQLHSSTLFSDILLSSIRLVVSKRAELALAVGSLNTLSEAASSYAMKMALSMM